MLSAKQGSKLLTSQRLVSIHTSKQTLCAHKVKPLMTQEIQKWITKVGLADTKGHNMSFWGGGTSPTILRKHLINNE